MSYNYNQLIAQLANLAGTTTTQINFEFEVPHAIDYGEQRIFTDLDLIATVTTDTSQLCTPNKREVQIPGAFIVVKGINIITPAGSPPLTGSRKQCVRASQDVMDFLFPDAGSAAVPYRFHVLNQGFGSTFGTVLLGPWPDQAYTVEFVGTQRPAPISASNPNTFLATTLPHLFEVACMVHLSAYQKNWSALGSDPQSSAAWEQQYKTLLVGCDAEELRKRYEGSSAFPPWGFDKAPSSPDAKA